jgi:hypothetical protein
MFRHTFSFQADLELGPVSHPQLRAVLWLLRDDRHCLVISIGKWSEFNAEYDARYTVESGSFVIAMSRTSEVAEGL